MCPPQVRGTQVGHLELPCGEEDVFRISQQPSELSGSVRCPDASVFQSQILSKTKQGNASWPEAFSTLSAERSCGD